MLYFLKFLVIVHPVWIIAYLVQILQIALNVMQILIGYPNLDYASFNTVLIINLMMNNKSLF